MGTAFAVVLVAAIAVIPRREHLTTKDATPPESGKAAGGKPAGGGYSVENRFLVATRIYDFIRLRAPKKKSRT